MLFATLVRLTFVPLSQQHTLASPKLFWEGTYHYEDTQVLHALILAINADTQVINHKKMQFHYIELTWSI
jgi:hypothetical protein